MTSKSDILALADRVEKAEGPDRELDYAVHEALHGKWLRQNAYTRELGDNGWASPTPPVKGANYIAAPQSYTASLDAAMTLVPEGYRVCAIGQSLAGTEWFAKLGYICDFGGLPATSASTPALALTAASLRAIAEVGG